MVTELSTALADLATKGMVVVVLLVVFPEVTNLRNSSTSSLHRAPAPP